MKLAFLCVIFRLLELILAHFNLGTSLCSTVASRDRTGPPSFFGASSEILFSASCIGAGLRGEVESDSANFNSMAIPSGGLSQNCTRGLKREGFLRIYRLGTMKIELFLFNLV